MTQAKTIGFVLLGGAIILVALAFGISQMMDIRSDMRDRVAETGEGNTTIENEVAGTGKQVYHLNVDGVRREFIVYRPDTVSEDEALPVVFMYHGGNQNGEIFYENSGWVQKADEEGFMVVFPTALKYRVYAEEKVKNGEVYENVSEYGTRWSGFKLEDTLDPDYPDQEVHDDVEFTRAMVEFLEENYAVDRTRFYATGFSNGGGFVNRLMVDATDIFAAFASNASGGLSAEGLEAMGDFKPDDFTPQPSIVLIGSEDPKLLNGATNATGTPIEEFSTDESAANEGDAVRLRYIDPFLEILELGDAYIYEREGRLSHFTFEEPATGSNSDAVFHMYVVDGMKHVYPNGTNYPLVAVDIYWSFFETYQL